MKTFGLMLTFFVVGIVFICIAIFLFKLFMWILGKFFRIANVGCGCLGVVLMGFLVLFVVAVILGVL